MARTDEEPANAAQGGSDFLGHEVAEIGIARRARLRKIVERQDGDRGTIRDFGHGPRFRTLERLGLAERRPQPMRRLRGGAGMGDLKSARRAAGDLCARVIH